MKYVDSNVFIYSLVNPLNDPKTIICRKILFKIANKDIFAATSFLSWDEFVYSIYKNLGMELAILEGNKFIRFLNLNFLKVDEEIILKAQDLISEYKIKPRDAIHAASALINNIDEIISDDQDFDKIKEIKRIKLEELK